MEIAVLDRGPGIDPDEMESIFDRFYRSETAAARTAGSGLGLTVCKRMMQAQAGEVWVRPRDDGGSAIGVKLPIYKNGANP
jgi:two-component system sensor histidine kinase MprB